MQITASKAGARRSRLNRARLCRFHFVLSFLLVSLWAAPTQALEPPSPEQLARYRASGTLPEWVASARALGNHKVSPALLSAFQRRSLGFAAEAKGQSAAEARTTLSVPPSGLPQSLQSKGTNRIFALLIEFPDYPAIAAASTIDAGLFGDGLASDAPYDSLRNFYRRSSYNQLEIQGVTLGYFRSAHTRASLPQTADTRELLIREALTHFDSEGHDFSVYDNDGDGAIDYFCVYWTGPTEDGPIFWWPSYIGWWSSSFTLDGKDFTGATYSWQDEVNVRGNMTRFTPMAVIHETGHALGLPDLYDYDSRVGPGGGVGGLDMMGTGRGDHNCFSKLLLDWITPVVAVNGSTYTLAPSGSSPEALIIWPGYSLANPFTEFFMVQNRTRVGNDAASNWPTDGLLIWHVDARLDGSGVFAYNNSYTGHKLLRLMEADGLEEIEASVYSNAGNAGDFYSAGETFGPTTIPNSSAYDGTVTGVGVGAISPAGNAFAFTVYSAPPPTLTVERFGTGSGSVSSTPSGINCGTACTAVFSLNTIVTLIPAADGNASFAGWTGACTGTGVCQVSMSEARSVTAHFALSQETVLVTAAYTAGAFGSFFVTDVQVVNPTNMTLEITPHFQNQAAAGTAVAGPAFQIPPRATRTFANILQSLFGVSPPSYGPIRLQGSAALIASANVYTTNACGTVGISYQGVARSQARAAGLFAGMASDANHRTNLIFYNPSASTAHIVIDYGSGILQSLTLPAEGWTQLNNIGKERGVTSPGYYLTYTSTQPVLGLATILDNTSNQSIAVNPTPY